MGKGLLGGSTFDLINKQERIHFAGAYADNMSWGMEAATRSTNRVAKVIDEA